LAHAAVHFFLLGRLSKRSSRHFSEDEAPVDVITYERMRARTNECITTDKLQAVMTATTASVQQISFTLMLAVATSALKSGAYILTLAVTDFDSMMIYGGITMTSEKPCQS
jgi:hypothetical protein